MEEVRDIIRNYFENIRPDLSEKSSSLENVPLRQLIDSIGMIEFLCFLEEKFNIAIEDSEIVPEHFDSIERISIFVEQIKARRPQSIE